MSRPPRVAAAIALAIGSMAFASSAEAAQVIVGSPLAATFGGALCSGPSGTWANPILAEPGANATSPVSGAIVGWKLVGNYSGGPFKLRVLRPAGSGQYTGAGSSAEVSPVSGAQAYLADIPIAAGDLVALDVHEGCVGVAGVTGSHVINWNPVLADGSTSAPPYPFHDVELGFDAEVQPAPKITGLDETMGSVAGGTSVTIRGTDLERASAVRFGSTPAAGFTGAGEGAITAVSPPSAVVGRVPVTVTTVAGTAISTASFSYEGCVVPKLKGKSLKAARKRLGHADCKLGKVKGQKGKAAKVKTQKPPPGKVLGPGSKVNVKLA